MSATLSLDLPAVRRPTAPAVLGRRQFLIGTTLLGGALAAGVEVSAPRWGDGAPNRLLASSNAADAPPAPPKPIQHGPLFRQEWLAFCARYVTAQGRVIDNANGFASHSEGQGWGLMAAQAADDPATFALLLEWTAHHLQRRPADALHAWRYRPSDPNPVSDLNNATDGDLFIAAALARAAARWNRPDYASAAARIARDVLGLVRHAGSGATARTLLLPGVLGFDKPDAYTLNPSYYTFALFPDLAAVAPSPLWAALRDDGLALMMQARFGRFGLPPDWLRVDRRTGALSEAPGWPARFSYDAIRVPLHLAWAGLQAGPMLDSFNKFWTSYGRGATPAWIDLRSQEVAGYAAPQGFIAVAAVALRNKAVPAVGSVTIPSVASAKDYYSAGLILLSLIAAGESQLMAAAAKGVSDVG